MTCSRGFARNKAARLLGAGLVILALVACSSPSQSQDEQASASVPAPAMSAASLAVPASAGSAAMSPFDQDAVIGRVSAVIRTRRLTTLQDECLDYMIDGAGGATVDIDVHAKHDANCGGDPNTSPRLFSFKLDRASGQLTTDALHPADGDFQPIE